VAIAAFSSFFYLEKQMYNTELYHHGIKGQRWGIRRYQNTDGSLKPAGEGRYDDGLTRRQRKKAAKKYDYKSNETYKDKSASSKRARTNMYNTNKNLYGKKEANRIEYEVDHGGNRKKAERKALARTVVKSMAYSALITAAPYAIAYGRDYYKRSRMQAQSYSYFAGAYGNANGLNEVKGGFTTGFRHARAGREFMRRYMGR